MWQAPILVRVGIRGICGLLLVVGLAALAACGAPVAQVNHAATAAAANAAKAQQQLDALARQAIASYTQQVQTTFDASNGTAQVEATVAWTADIGHSDVAKEQERAKTICFLVQQAAWTGGVATAQLTAIVLGPVLTGYTTYTTDAHAAARLTAHTAKGCAWASLAPDAAWSCYDEAYLRSDYDPPVVALPPSVA